MLEVSKNPRTFVAINHKTLYKMNEKVNIAELLKDCPDGMELDCTMFEKPVKYIGLTKSGTYVIIIKTSLGKEFYLTKDGRLHDMDDAKCIIYPKGKTTWEGFVPPCNFKDGEFLTYNSTVGTTIFIYRNKKDEHTYKTSFYVALNGRGKLLEYNKYTLVALNGDADTCLATEEEKEKLLQAIKDNGYRWNDETKTLKKITVPHTTKKFYIRIGEIPSDEKSAVHRGDAVVGYEDGVSVYDCVETDGLYRIVMPLPLKEGQGMTYEGMIQEITQCRYKIAKPRNVYLVSGTEVGKGHDNEPLIKDVKILEDLTEQFNTKSDNTEKTIVKTEFREGDVVCSGVSLISILKNISPSKTLNCYVSTDSYNKLYINEGGWTSQNLRHATEEEEKKLFKVLNNNGYKWNPDTKTLDRLFEIRFKVGDKIRRKGIDKNVVYEINNVYDDSYGLVGSSWVLYMRYQDDYELVSKKFDINTLKPFDKVLTRANDNVSWVCNYYSHRIKDYYVVLNAELAVQCIPYEGNEHLLGTTDDCDDYYKIWND